VPARSTLVAFLGIVVLGGFNGVAIRFSNHELAPFWGATLRFALAAAILFGIVAIRRLPLPRGAALTGSLLYGLLGFAASYAFIYWGLVETPAGLAQVILALVPLLTFLLAVLHGLERFRWQNLAGALLSLGGIAVIFGDRIGSAVPVVSMLAVLASAVCMAETNVVVKRFPKSHPVASNAVAMGLGSAILLVISLVAGESRALPVEARTWAAVGYLVVVGSVAVFILFLYVIERWTASATSYFWLLLPLVSVNAAAWLAGEAVTPAFLAGGAVVLAGVYVGAFAPSFGRLLPGLLPRPAVAPVPATVGPPEPPAFGTPGCP
jgi:drug/metabolite transporter (DMT)-like permease